MKKQDSTEQPAFPPQSLRIAYLNRFDAAAVRRLETVFALRATTQQITNVLNGWLEDTVGTPVRFQTLALLWASDGPLPHQEIITALQVKRATVSALMFSLEQEGLVRSVGDQKDRRRLLATLTEEGKKLVLSAMEINAVRVERALAGFSPEELVLFQSLLTRAKDGFLQASAQTTP